MSNAIKGVIMELADCAYPVLTKIVGTTDYKVRTPEQRCSW
jgi:hypothetical protein